MFKIMSEFVDGFEKMERFGPCISIFGSAFTKPGHPHYQLAVTIAEKMTKADMASLRAAALNYGSR